MSAHSWRQSAPKRNPRPQVPNGLKDEISAQAAQVAADLKRHCRKKSKNSEFNWLVDMFARWHRDALYFVAVIRTSHGRPPTFESHVARMEHCGDGKFDLALPIRRGWNTISRNLAPSDCLQEISKLRL